MLPSSRKEGHPNRYSTGETAEGTPNVNLVQNPAFATDTIWTKGAGWTIAGGKATRIVAAASALSQAGIISDLTVNYAVLTDIVVTAGSVTPKGGTQVGAAIAASDPNDFQFIQFADNGELFYDADAAFAGDINSSSVIKIEEAAVQLKTEQGSIYTLFGHNNASGTRYIMFFDTDSAPSYGDVPFAYITVAADSDFELPLKLYGTHFKNGLAIVNSLQKEFLDQGNPEIFITSLYK